ncbi:hypothetical protein AX774_g3373 [Zancudomyces culisetae]|uniref:OV-16 antigen n=1 Tax=Zancudomyces culisetae TaxID=1213189 RepID=A0A1R1PQ65_ZANCU|nr:hypothetical protein AX774_g3373 [Zancudomyces culisetae]|eukprot:OMH83125.1 hypothetical protein AX774_g3373 [Zancudomyces culisetae]
MRTKLMQAWLLLLYGYQSFVRSQTYNQETILSRLEKSGIIPTVLSEDFFPTTNLLVDYTDISVVLGTELDPAKNQTSKLPSFNYATKPRGYYTLALLKVSQNSTLNHKLYYLNVNIPNLYINLGNDTGIPYNPPEYPVACSPETYVFVLAAQSYMTPSIATPGSRDNFNIQKFASDCNMNIIGANYFVLKPKNTDRCQNTQRYSTTIINLASESGCDSRISMLSSFSIKSFVFAITELFLLALLI